MIDFFVSVTPAEERRLKELINALRTNCKVKMNSNSLFNINSFESEFPSKLLTQHCFMGSPLFVDTLHISKLTEAAWIQDCRTAAKRREHTHRLFKEYCSEVDAIVQLRYFQSLQLYELFEIPVSLFSQIMDVGRDHFSADGPTINIPIGKNPPDFTLKLDRSDAKVTIARINKHLCLVHGIWQL